jgi:hypothetical protein
VRRYATFVSARLGVRGMIRISRLWGASELVAPKRVEYMDMLNRPLTCIVFVPTFLLTFERYTTRVGRG